jgi:chloramphenicol-sensitive protein RarD
MQYIKYTERNMSTFIQNLNLKKPGELNALMAFVLWGILPLYWKLLLDVPVFEFLAHRIVWCFVFLGVVLYLTRQLGCIRRVIQEPKILISLSMSTIFIASTWLIFIWAVQNGRVIEASLGYFINPIIFILLGAIFLKEKLSPQQWIGIGFIFISVLALIYNYGQIPWVALGLTTAFSLYGFSRKKVDVGALTGLWFETALLTIPMTLYLVYLSHQGTLHFLHNGWERDFMLLAAGIFTALPLMFFARAAKKLKLSVLGIFQYIGPSLNLLVAIFVLKETFTVSYFISFIFIWVGILVFSIRRHPKTVKAGLK